MAAFDPQFQTPSIGVQDYKPITQPLSDKSTGLALDTVAKGLEGGTKIVDTAIKENIDNTLFDKVKAVQDDFLSTLDNVASSKGIKYNDPMNAHAEVLPPPEPDVPAGVSGAVDQATTLQNAYQAGKLSKIGLDQRLLPILKDVRASNPGYRDYVDQKMSEITGYNVANSLVTEKIAQINQNATNQQKQQDYYEIAIVNSGFDKSSEVLQQFQQDHNISKVQSWLATNNEMQSRVTNTLKAFELSSKVQGDITQKAELAANDVAQHAASSFYANRRLTQSDSTDQELADKLYEQTMDPSKRDPEVIRQIGAQLMYHMQRNNAETLQVLNQASTVGPDGKRYSIAQVLGPEKIKNILDANINTLYKAQLNMIGDEQLGLVHMVQNTVGDLSNKKALQVLTDPSTAGYAQTATAIQKLMPQLSPQITQDIIGSYKSTNPNNGVGSQGFIRDAVALGNVQRQQAITQTGGQDNGPYTIKQSIDEQSKGANIAKYSNGEISQELKKFVGLSKGLTEKNPQVVDNLINYFYHPSNGNYINKWMDDYYDKSTGQVVQGRTEAFSQLTTPEITQSVWDRAHNGNTNAWDNYKHFADVNGVAALTNIAKTWNQNEDTWRKEKDLRSNPPDPSDPNTGLGASYHFYWNTTSHQIGATDIKGNVLDTNNMVDLLPVRNANRVLGSLANIARQENNDPRNIDASLFRSMLRAGWDPKELDTKGPSLPSKVMQSLLGAHNKPVQPLGVQ